MKLSDLFKDLAVGDLRNLSMAENKTIREADQETVVLFINEGLTNIHSRFDVNLRDLLIETHKHITFYHLLKRFAESQADVSPEPFLYIKDLSLDPFLEDVIKVKAVYGSKGQLLPLNDGTRMDSVFTPQPLILQVPHPRDGELLTVFYKARLEPVKAGNLGQLIDLPDVLHKALRSYVAFKVFSTLGTVEAAQVAATHFSSYEATCKEAEALDLVNTSVVPTNTRFQRNTWI